MTKYNTDFYGWTQETANLLRQHKFSDLDLEALIEEVESMGRSERNEVVNRLSVLLSHLLKWQYQPKRRGKSWRLTIKGQREDIPELLSENPSLKPEVPVILERAYRKAVIEAAKQTPFDTTAFPISCPWSLEQILAEDFYPN